MYSQESKFLTAIFLQFDIFFFFVCLSLNQVDKAMLPGLTLITWSSMNFSNFANTIRQKIDEFRLFLKQVGYMYSIS